MVFLASKKRKVNIEEIVLNVIKERRSIRSYVPGVVSDEQINKILEAGSYAPSAGNYQPWEFIVVRNSETKEALIDAAFNQVWMKNASVFIVVCTNMRIARAIYGDRGERLYGPQSVGAAIQNMLLAAHALGLGACWVGSFSEPKVSTILELPDYIRPGAIITIGIPAEIPEAPKRHSLSEITYYEKFTHFKE
ncbi:MAG: nitroreductase family protein [Candidatus Aenigmatarchaeota archaeon]